MKLTAEIAGQNYAVSPTGYDLSIPLLFDGPQPNTYGVPHATARAFEGDGFIGDTRRGGSCNFETYTLTPHCNGTHTECVGHITDERIPITDVLMPGLHAATLVTVTPTTGQRTVDSYDPDLDAHDLVIDEAMLMMALDDSDSDFHTAIVIRTNPNSEGKRQRDYVQERPAFFTHEAMEYLLSLGLTHLLVDLPSVDRLYDEGKLTNHHIYWEVPQGSHVVEPKNSLYRTITEMIFVPEFVPDGHYLLDLQIAAFESDAAPSRPVLYPLVD